MHRTRQESMYSFDNVIRRNVSRFPRKTASRFNAVSHTYEDLDQRVNLLVNSLNQLGLKHGERIAYMSRNSHIYIEGILAAAKEGFVLTTLNFLLNSNELAYILRHSDATAILFQSEFASLVNQASDDCPDLIHFVSLDEPVDFALEYEELLESSSDNDFAVAVNEDDLLMLVYTSGTTGKPKGVMLSHRNICANVIDAVCGLELSQNTVNLNVCPLYHVAASVFQTLTTFYIGGTSVTLEKFDPQHVLEAIERERITYTFLVPTMIFRILELSNAAEHDLSSLVKLGYGAAPMPLDRLKKAIGLFGPILFQGYGQTESTANICILRAEDHDLEADAEKLERLKSCGRDHSSHEIRILDPDGLELESGNVGEICVRSSSVMEGYWKDPEKTREAIQKGWLRTGDMAYMDQDRYIYIVGRKNDLINSGGEKIYPQEIEEVLFEHPAVQEAAVCGVSHQDWGEVPMAFVVLRPQHTASEDELKEYCTKKLPRFKCPKEVAFLSELPKTASGKITRAGLKKQYAESGNSS